MTFFQRFWATYWAYLTDPWNWITCAVGFAIGYSAGLPQ